MCLISDPEAETGVKAARVKCEEVYSDQTKEAGVTVQPASDRPQIPICLNPWSPPQTSENAPPAALTNDQPCAQGSLVHLQQLLNMTRPSYTSGKCSSVHSEISNRRLTPAMIGDSCS